MVTAEGLSLDAAVDGVRVAMGLTTPVGCVEEHYFADHGVAHSQSLYGLYLYSVVPAEVFSPPYNESQILVTGTGL